ncbi:MAG: GyrI-like domain-containing protein, partial [Raoultibacter sp.]
FAWACDEVARKKPRVDLKEARFEIYEEGLCVQIMHKGPYDDEPVTIEKLETFVGENGYSNDFSNSLDAYPIGRRHHEVYLGDPRRTKPENLRTVIRHPIRKNA